MLNFCEANGPVVAAWPLTPHCPHECSLMYVTVVLRCCRYYSSWIEAEERATDDTTTSDSLALSESMQRRKVAEENHRPEPETTEEKLLKYHDFDVPSMTKSFEEYEVSWGDDDINESSKNHDSGNESSSEEDEDDEDNDDFGDEMSLKAPRSISSSSFHQKKSKATDSSDDVLFSVDESFFQIGEVSDSDVS